MRQDETKTPEALKADTMLTVVNSICGRADSDQAATVISAASQPIPPSNPAMFFFKGGKPVVALQRRDIESSDAFTLSPRLKAALEQHC